ncbi:MAG: alanine racemase [Ruminococcaceae bacterium]|nr:alanine racemase [Oscillospiraceae bacterium]
MTTEEKQTRAWAEVDVSALVHNFKELKALVPSGTKMLATVKANAYGHGATVCAKELLAAGADYLAVATADEALSLRSDGIMAPILILGHTANERMEALIEQDITMAIFSLEQAKILSLAAQKLQKTAQVHIKINTGMERIGFSPEQVAEISACCKQPGLLAEGIFTHLACADAEDSSSVHKQYERFMGVIQELGQAGITFPLRHILNSAGMFDFPEYALDMVRAGISLYGYYPSRYVKKERAKLIPVMSIKAKVTHLHKVAAGTGISYGWTYAAPEDRLIATVPIGYADGYFRLYSNRATMLAQEKPVPVVGRICMDQCMIDVSSVNTINVGDEIIIMGKRGDAQITADDLAELIGTISYEILCATGERLPRVYINSGNSDVLNG